MDDRQRLKAATPYLLFSWVLFGFVLDAFWGEWTQSFPLRQAGALAGAMVGIVVLTTGSIWWSRRQAAARAFGGGTLRRTWSGVATNIGPLLRPIQLARRPTGKGSAKEHRPQGFDAPEALTDHADHAALFLAASEVLHAYPQTPAAPNPVDHGGLNLLEHTRNVIEALAFVRQGYSFAWPKTPGIVLVFNDPDYDPSSIFNDPVLPVAAILHDIGKITCYLPGPTGIRVSRQLDHGPAGAELIAAFPEWTRLPPKDRSLLVQVVSHYHAPRHYPWLRAGRSQNAFRPDDDRAPVIMDVLYKADLVAGKKESRDNSVDYDLGGAERESADSLAKDGVLYGLLCDLLMEPGALDGKTESKLGWKHNNVVYLFEERLRVALYKKFMSPAGHAESDDLAAASAYRMGDGNYTITTAVRIQLAEKHLLYQEHEGRWYGPARALWIVELYDDSRTDPKTQRAKKIAEFPAMIVFRLHAADMAGAVGAQDISKTPRILRARWGVTSARKIKPSTPAELRAANHDPSDTPSEDEMGCLDQTIEADNSVPRPARWGVVTDVPEARSARGNEFVAEPAGHNLGSVDESQALAAPPRKKAATTLTPREISADSPTKSESEPLMSTPSATLSPERIRRVLYQIAAQLVTGATPHLLRDVPQQGGTFAFIRLVDLPAAVHGVRDAQLFHTLVQAALAGNNPHLDLFAVQTLNDFDGEPAFIFKLPQPDARDEDDQSER